MYTDAIRKAVEELEDACMTLKGICNRIESTRPHDDPGSYKTVKAFEDAWAVHYRAIEDHQHAMHNYDEAVAEVQEALSRCEPPDFYLA